MSEVQRAVVVPAISAVALAITVVLSGCSLVDELVGGGRAARDADGRIVEGHEATDAFTLAVGDCLDDSGAADQVVTVPTTPCSEPHDSEVYAAVMLTSDAYPGREAILERADAECLTEFEVFVGGDWSTSPYDFSYYFPTEGSWAEGDREILCVIYDPSGKVTGSLEGIGR